MRSTSHPPAPVVALMYHALSQGAPPPGQDPHYTLDEARFRAQLRRIDAAGGGTCARDWLAGAATRRVLLTFDDGHVSNHRVAFPALVEHGMRADFFVNPGNVGKTGYAAWQDLRQMSEAGMSIQSHGYDHVYLTTLDARTLRDRLRAARERIEDRVGAPVTLLAPPGGRMPANLAAVARECGYRHVLSSRPGRIAGDGSVAVLPRLSVTTAIDERRFAAWISGDAKAIAREQTRYAALALAKRVLGDARYERLRAQALPGGGG